MFRYLTLLGMCMLLLGCNVLKDRIGEQEETTATPASFTTATPGGRISVWMVEPTGQASTPSPGVGTEVGQIVGPAATATAAAQRIFSATQTAAAPTPQPAFQSNECPPPTSIPAPPLPTSFIEFPQSIGVFLSNGGAPAVLENTLRNWSAINDRGGVVQADTDLTGDKIPEIVVTVFNPYIYNPDAALNAGRLMIFGCDNNSYRLLYITSDNPGLALPILHRVGDMNGDVKGEVVFDSQACTTSICTREGFILSWNPVVGLFETLNNNQIFSNNGRLGVVDVDSDGILEVTVTSQELVSPTSGPTRSVVDVWDWTGQSYQLALRLPDENTQYKIHVLQDADNALFTGNLTEAVRLYQQARDDDSLIFWNLPNEAIMLRAYALYRLTLGYAQQRNINRAGQALDALSQENPQGNPAYGLTVMAAAFMDQVRNGAGASAGCQAGLGAAAQHPEILAFLNSFGTSNRAYQFNELCPF